MNRILFFLTSSLRHQAHSVESIPLTKTLSFCKCLCLFPKHLSLTIKAICVCIGVPVCELSTSLVPDRNNGLSRWLKQHETELPGLAHSYAKHTPLCCENTHLWSEYLQWCEYSWYDRCVCLCATGYAFTFHYCHFSLDTQPSCRQS